MLTIYHESLQEYLSPDQILMVEMLVRVIQIFKEVKIEKLAARLPLPIKYESRRRAVQRFLISRGLEDVWKYGQDRSVYTSIGENPPKSPLKGGL